MPGELMPLPSAAGKPRELLELGNKKPFPTLTAIRIIKSAQVNLMCIDLMCIVLPLIFMLVSTGYRVVGFFFPCCFTSVTVSIYTTAEQWLFISENKENNFHIF